MAEDAARFEIPLYTVVEAARALAVPSSTFHTWARGSARLRQDGRRHDDGPVVSSTGGAASGPTIPFVGLAEGMVLAAIRRANVPLQRVRPALDVLREEMRIAHALASRRLFTGRGRR